MSAPLVSVIVPTYRGGAFLREAVDSAIAQTFRDIEIIVVEDGSDTARAALQGCAGEIKYIWQENQGVSGARNTGVRHASARWLAFLDHDDLWHPRKLERQLRLSEQSPQLDLIHCDHFVLRDGVKLPGPRLIPTERVPAGDVRRELFMNNFIILCTALVSKRAVVAAGGFDSRYLYAQDYDLWLRIARQHEFGFVNERLATYRDHESLGSNYPRALLDTAEVLAGFLAAYPDARRQLDAEAIRSRMSAVYWEAAYAHFAEGAYAVARKLFLTAWRWNKRRARPLVYGLACLTGARGMRAIRRLKAATAG